MKVGFKKISHSQGNRTFLLAVLVMVLLLVAATLFVIRSIAQTLNVTFGRVDADMVVPVRFDLSGAHRLKKVREQMSPAPEPQLSPSPQSSPTPSPLASPTPSPMGLHTP